MQHGVLSRNRKRTEPSQHVTSYRSEFGWIIGPDVEYASPLGLGEGIEANRHQHDFAGATGSLE